MPLPDAIQKVIKGMGDKFIPDAQRAEFKTWLPVWQLYLDLYELDEGKLKLLISKHSDDEDAAKYAMRQQLAAVFNYVPTIIRMVVNYIFSERPEIVAEDEKIKAFIANCDGSETNLSEFVRQGALPLSLVLGFVDVLVQNPGTPAGMFITAADEAEATPEVTPRVFMITPITRINWSTRSTHEYNWISFRDVDNESPNPFIEDPAQGDSIVRVCAHFTPTDEDGRVIGEVVDEKGNPKGFWVRSWVQDDTWMHDGDTLPTTDVPIAALYYGRSVDPSRRHFGISKISMIAILTRKIIQLLSWTDEDVLSNLALFVMPGEPPKDADGKVVSQKMTPWTVVYVGDDAKIQPDRLQGGIAQSEFKLKLIQAYVFEVMRLAFLSSISAEAEKIQSGVQGVVARNELFMELSDLASGLDRFVIDLLIFAGQWIYADSAPETRQEAIERYKLRVSFFKGPYALDPLETVIKNTAALMETFAEVSPEMTRAALRQCAAAALYNEDEALTLVYAEIDANLGRLSAERDATRRAIAESLTAGGRDDEGGGVPGTPDNPVDAGGGGPGDDGGGA